MERVYAFTDEYGSFGWDLLNPSVSTHFIITSIIISENNVNEVKAETEKIRKKFFQTGEMKSTKVSSNHVRRSALLSELTKLPFSIFSVVVDKASISHMHGLKYKKSFYKFLNNIMHKELKRAFGKLTIVADEIGNNEYMESFVRYFESKEDIPTLFDKPDFSFEISKENVIIQIADIISGTLAYEYDTHKNACEHPNYKELLESKLIRIELYPKTYDNYTLNESAIAEDYDKTVAQICFNQAAIYLRSHENETDNVEVSARVIVLKYLLFRFMNNDTRKYIPTKELIKQLSHTELHNIKLQSFRTKIIGKLRDENVIIASSSKGYKLPSKESELYDFINHGTTIIMPMLERLKKCRDIIKLGTLNELDLFDHTEYSTLKHYFDDE